MPRTPCTYQLEIVLVRAVRVRIGRLGVFRFPAGRYRYTGSARRNLPARVRRHLSRRKRRHWHIDYLLASPAARVPRVRYSALAECRLNQHTAGRIVAPGFGASDCAAGCGSHLKFIGAPLAFRPNPQAGSNRPNAVQAAAGARPGRGRPRRPASLVWPRPT